jgi:hypothetical protein
VKKSTQFQRFGPEKPSNSESRVKTKTLDAILEPEEEISKEEQAPTQGTGKWRPKQVSSEQPNLQPEVWKNWMLPANGHWHA